MAWRWPMAGMMGQMGPMGGMPPMGMPPMPGAQPPGLNMAAAAGRMPNWGTGGKTGGPKAGMSQANPPRSAAETERVAAVEGPAPGLEKDDVDDDEVTEDGLIEDEVEVTADA